MYSKRTEDYLEAIYTIIQKKGYARTKDIAEHLGVRPATVTGKLKGLNEKKLVNYERYSGVTLTPGGERIGKQAKLETDAVKDFIGIVIEGKKESVKVRTVRDPSREVSGLLGELVSFVDATQTPSVSRKFRKMLEENYHVSLKKVNKNSGSLKIT